MGADGKAFRALTRQPRGTAACKRTIRQAKVLAATHTHTHTDQVGMCSNTGANAEPAIDFVSSEIFEQPFAVMALNLASGAQVVHEHARTACCPLPGLLGVVVCKQ